MGMPISQLVDEDVQLSLLATSGHAGLAAELLTQRFGLSMEYASSVLEQGYGLLAARMDRRAARAALPLLVTLGLRVAIQPCEALPPDEVCDLSVRVATAAAVAKAVMTLARLQGVEAAAADFAGPEGLVLRGMNMERAEWLCNAMRQLPGVTAALSEQQMARYDLFSEAELTEEEATAVRRHLRILGCDAGAFGDAIGTGMDRRVLKRVLDRFPSIGLFGVNQAFQRHELLIIGKGSLSQTEFVDFLTTRPISQTVPAHKLARSLPLRVESSMTRKAARQFLADYSAIGMQAVTRLVRHNPALKE
jgi:hypothetical protein